MTSPSRNPSTAEEAGTDTERLSVTEQPAYPQHWEADVLLADGGVVHLRPSSPADGEAIRAMHERTSDRSLYLRYFAAVSVVSDAQIALFTDVDHDTRVGLVAESDGQIIAAGNYVRAASHPESAEVAFLVEDAWQGRGLGSVLLEHLAAAADERGVRRFTAEVLGENRTMMRVFLDAGYGVTREFSSGVVDLGFDIRPTDSSRAVMASREQRAESRSIARLLSPSAIAVIGASNDRSKLGHTVLANLLRGSFTGPVFPVNPESRSVLGVRAYPSVTDIPDPVDLAVVAVPAAGVHDVLRACRAKGVYGLVVMSGGFADAGEDGADAQRTLVRLARANGMRVLGPNCLGMVNTDPAVSMNATLAPVVPAPGRVGFFCQSGALGIAILADAAARRLGLSSFVSAGNRADVSGNDLLQYWQSDDATEVVLLYLESFGNARKFARLARTVARSKPVITVKSGRHALVSPGLPANAASISGTAVATLFAQSGVIRTGTLAEAFDVAQLLSTQPLPAGSTVAVIGNSTALGVLAVDACLDAGLTIADGAPLDLGVAVSPEDLAAAVRRATASPDVHAVVVVYVRPVAAPGLAHAAALRAAAADATMPVLSTFLAVNGLPEHLATTGPDGSAARGSVPSYRTPERAVAALAHAARYGQWLARPLGSIPALAGVDRVQARELVAKALDASTFTLDRPSRRLADDELVPLLACYGIAVVAFREVRDADAACRGAVELGYPVAVKTDDHRLRHSEDQAGVRLMLADEAAVRGAYRELAALTDRRLYVQRMAPPGIATMLGICTDPSFGALVSFGIGGVATDLLDDVAYRAVPLTDADATELIITPRAAPLLGSYRGREPVDTAPLVDLALRLSALADDVPELTALMLRPVLIGQEGMHITGAEASIGHPALVDERRRLR